jgi:hypothetical protein
LADGIATTSDLINRGGEFGGVDAWGIGFQVLEISTVHFVDRSQTSLLSVVT